MKILLTVVAMSLATITLCAQPNDSLDKLSGDFWTWRAKYAPFNGDDVPRMMSVGLHPRITGNPGRSDGLARFIDYGQSLGDVWFARRIDIANTFIEQEPAASWVSV